MLSKFAESLGEKLAERWIGIVLTPAFAFWVGGLSAWLWKEGWSAAAVRLQESFTGLPLIIQVSVVLAGLMITIVSAVVAQHCTFAVLQALEGYWPRYLQPLRRRLTQRWQRRLGSLEKRWQTLRAKHDSLEPVELEEYKRLDAALHRAPDNWDRLMPTRLGNLLRASEARVTDKYGLDVTVCWARLWLVLPKDVQEEVTSARTSLDTASRGVLWGLLFVVWSFWAWWAAPAALVVVLVCYRWAIVSAEVYGQLVESVFDLHRFTLYESLHWPRPKNSEVETSEGQLITEYLWRGWRDPAREFESDGAISPPPPP